MSTSPILTQGIGAWGGAQYIPTLGFGIGEEIIYEPGLAIVTSSMLYKCVASSAADRCVTAFELVANTTGEFEP